MKSENFAVWLIAVSLVSITVSGSVNHLSICMSGFYGYSLLDVAITCLN
jgi:hypothetical protein